MLITDCCLEVLFLTECIKLQNELLLSLQRMIINKKFPNACKKL